MQQSFINKTTSQKAQLEAPQELRAFLRAKGDLAAETQDPQSRELPDGSNHWSKSLKDRGAPPLAKAFIRLLG